MIGLWWYDASERRLAQKVAIAAARHAQKYGTVPNTCYVHPDMMPASEVKVGAVIVKPLRAVSPDYFWIGQEEEESREITETHIEL